MTISIKLKKERYQAILNACTGDSYNINYIASAVGEHRVKVSSYCKTLSEHGFLHREKLGRDIATKVGGSAKFLYTTLKHEITMDDMEKIETGIFPEVKALFNHHTPAEPSVEKPQEYDGKPRVFEMRHNPAKGILSHANYRGQSSLGMI